MPVTQFDNLLLRESIGAAPPVCRNHGRHVRVMPDGRALTALTWGTTLRVWRNREMIREEAVEGVPCIDEEGRIWTDACDVSHGFRAVRRADGLHVVAPDGREVLIDSDGDTATLDVVEGVIHLVYEQHTGIEYRRLNSATLAIERAERLTQAFTFAPVIVVHEGRVFIAFQGQSTRPDKRDGNLWDDSPWQRRMGMGGYIGLLIGEGTGGDGDSGGWQRRVAARTLQFAKAIWPLNSKFVYDTQHVDVRPRMEEFTAPGLCVGPDGVPFVAWSDMQRRWMYSARITGDTIWPATELRGPLEQLVGPPLLPRRCDAASGGDVPLVMVTQTRCYLDAIHYHSRQVVHGRTIDFLQPDELAEASGVEIAVNAMQRHPENPLLRAGERGEHDKLGIAVSVRPDERGWRGEALAWSWPRTLSREEDAISEDGIHWRRGRIVGEDETVLVDGQPRPRGKTRISAVRDEAALPEQRYKGLWKNPEVGAFGAWMPAYSADGVAWTTCKEDPARIMCDEDLIVWRDEHDQPQRRYKAIGNARGLSGRLCCQWASRDGLHWTDTRDYLDFDDPFGKPPYFCEQYPNGGGRIIVDPWAGPDDEDEIHGGYVFRDGDRWLCHYMKWSSDGLISNALASSRDGINFARVAGGVPVLPLGDAGTWDSGRVALRNPPVRVGDVWYQHYTGSAWKHGMAGTGKAPHKNEHEMALFSPMQLGLATIDVGRWGHLRLAPDAESGRFVTAALSWTQPMALHVDAEANGGEVRVTVLDAATRRSIDVNLDAIPPGTYRLEVRLTGRRPRVYGLKLVPAANQVRTLRL